MSACYTYLGITYTEKELYNRIRYEIQHNPEQYQQLKNIILDASDDVEKLIKHAHSVATKNWGDKSWIGVSEFIDLEHYLGTQNGVAIRLHLSPAYDKDARIKNSIELMLSRPEIGGDVSKAMEILEAQMAAEDAISDFGEIVHNLLQIAVEEHIKTNKPGTESKVFLDELVKTKSTLENSKEYTDKNGNKHAALLDVLTRAEQAVPSIDSILEKIVSTVNTVENNIFSGRDSKTKYFTEYQIATDELIGDIKDKSGNVVNGLKGRMDLLIINPDGTTEVIDFKVASRPYKDWYLAKVYHTDYLLGTYRAILAANGIDGRKVILKTQPIYFPLGKVMQMRAEYSQNRNISATRLSHLDWDNGKFTNNLRFLISNTIIPLNSENISLDLDIKKTIEDILGKYQTDDEKNNKNTKELIEKSIFPSQINGKTVYNLYNRVPPHNKMTKTNKEEFTKPGGVIDTMLEQLQHFYSNQIKSLVSDIKKYQNEEVEGENIELLSVKADSNLNVYNVLQSNLGKYCNSSYKLIEFPELLDLGIFIFLHKTTGIYDVVRVSNENLRAEVSNNGGSTVLGKFTSNAQALLITNFKPMQSTIANMQLIEVMCALNNVAQQLQNGLLGTIKIINPFIGQAEPVNLDLLRANFAYLCQKSGIDNNFDSVIKTVDAWNAMQRDLHDIIANVGLVSDLHQIVAMTEMDHYTKNLKVDLILKMMEKLADTYSTLRYTDMSSVRTFDTPEQKVYYVLSLALLYYKETPIRYDGKLTKWGLHFEELVRLLGTPFMGEYKLTLNNGNAAVGLGQGMDMSTPTSNPSTNLSALYQFWDTAFQHLRTSLLKLQNYLNKLCLDYVNRKTSGIQRALINSTYIWGDLIEKDSEGKYTKDFKLKNPYNESENIDAEDRKFLKLILWEFNKYILPGITEEQRAWHYSDHELDILNLASVQDARAKEIYYQIPLRRSSDFERLRNIGHIGLKLYFSKEWDSLRDMYDPRQLHSSARRRIDSESRRDITKMYNQYKLSQGARENIIESEGVYDFEIDLNLLTADVAFQFERKRLFEDALLHANAMATVMHYLLQTSDVNFDEELQNLDDLIKVSLKNETLIPKELLDVSKAISLAKKVNGLIVLGVRPLLFIKEITFGLFTNYSRALATKGTNQQISASNLFKANMLVWGKLSAGWLRAVSGQEDLAAFTLVLILNKTYGIANEDLNTIVEKNSLSRMGILRGLSKYLYIFNALPDFFNRMTLFIGKMLEDGCFDAHELDSDGNLVYDIKKDKRFSKLVKYGLDYKTSDLEYLRLKGLFRAMVTQFKLEKFTKPDGSPLQETELYLPRAYTVKEKQSMKELSDLAYGYYDHEAKSLQDHKFIGLVFKQFMAFWTAKTTLWLRKPGANTAMGSFVQRVDENGKPLFIKVTEDQNGILSVEYTTENPIGDLEPAYTWQGDYVEGLVYSIGYTIRDIFKWNWEDIVGNKQRLGNLKLALHDILIGIILYNILKLIFSGGTGKMKDANPAERTLLRAMQDTSPSAIFGLSLTPSFVSTLEGLKSDMFNLFDEDITKSDLLRKRFGALKDITWEQH